MNFFRVIQILFSAFFLIFSTASLALATEARKPNIVFVLFDDLDVVTTKQFYDRVLPKTMQLKSEGVYFDNAFVSSPICCPSRATILSGKYGHNTNVLTNGGEHGGREQFYDDEPRTIAARLYHAGYRTGIFGKYLNGFDIADHNEPTLPYGWTDGDLIASPNMKAYRGYNYNMMSWRNGTPAANPLRLPLRQGQVQNWVGSEHKEHYGERDEDYSTDVVKRKALEFFERVRTETPNKPFFAFVSPTCPHFPIPPARRHHAVAQQWGFGTLPRSRPNFVGDVGAFGESDEVFPEDKPRWLQWTWNKRQRLQFFGGRFVDFWGGDHPDNQGDDRGMWSWHDLDWYNRMGSLYACDELVDELVQSLKANGEWENTLFVFYSDNGYNLGAHSLAQKMVPYEESLRVPLIVAGGEGLGIKAGTHNAEWILNTDFGPTFLDFATGENAQDFDGMSFRGFVDNRVSAPTQWRNQFMVEYHGGGLAHGYFADFLMYQFAIAPAFFLDVPTYEGVRAKRWVIEDGVPREKNFLYVRWERFPHMLTFNRRLRHQNRFLMRRIRQGRPLAMRRFASATAYDYELYDLDQDPYELDNLMYWEPEKYNEVSESLADTLTEIRGCGGTNVLSHASCNFVELQTTHPENSLRLH